jgi:hypothetical protein
MVERRTKLMSKEYTRPFYEIVCSLNNYKLGTIIESETGQRYKLTKTDNEYRKFSRIDKGLRFLTYENMNKKFRIVEEQEEIDIQSIEKIIDYRTSDDDLYNDNFEDFRGTINELIEAVKQLDKKQRS